MVSSRHRPQGQAETPLSLKALPCYRVRRTTMDQRERELLAALRASRASETEQPPKKETELSLAEWIWEKEKEWNQRHVEVGRTIERLSFNEEGNLTTKQVEMLKDALRHWSR